MCEERACRYLTFLAQLARLKADAARMAGAGIKAMMAERAVPESVFGRKRMARDVALTLPKHKDCDRRIEQGCVY